MLKSRSGELTREEMEHDVLGVLHVDVVLDLDAG
jgi:hypothetical protein